MQQNSNVVLNMRVLSICDISPNRFGSFEEFLVELTEKLTETDFEHIIVFREMPTKDVEETLLNLDAKLKVFKPSRYNIFNFFSFVKIVQEVQPEIVHFHFYPIYTVVNYLKFIFNIKIIYTDHMGGRTAKNPLKKLLRRVYYYTNSKLFDCGINKIICVSNFVKSKYSKEYGIQSNKLCVIYNGINIDRFQKKSDISQIKAKYNIKYEFIITCVGLRKDKGAHYLVKAAPLILKQILNVKLILVGEGDCKNHLELLLEKHGLKSYTVFTGNVPEIASIYNISSCVVIPSLFEEAFCFVAVEAMATETPIVAFDSGAIKEVMYSPDQVVKRDYEILADKIIACLKSNTLKQKKARKHVLENFTVDKCVSSYIDLYNNLLGGI